MNMREAFGAWSVFPETDCRNSWDAFQAGAAHAARECLALIPGGSIVDPQIVADEIRAAFPEAWK